MALDDSGEALKYWERLDKEERRADRNERIAVLLAFVSAIQFAVTLGQVLR